MQKIDRIIGPITCIIFLLAKKVSMVSGLLRNTSIEENIQNILVIKFLGMGTILLASPALRSLKEIYPSAKVTLLTARSNEEMCRILPFVDNVVSINVSNPMSFFWDIPSALIDIRRRDFDVIIDLEFFSRCSAAITLLITMFVRGKRQKTVGFASPQRWRNDAYSISVAFDYSKHISEIFVKAVSCFGVRSDVKLSFEEERNELLAFSNSDFVKSLYQDNPFLKECNQLFVININAGDLCLHRRWPREYFAILIEEITRFENCAIFLIGGNDEVPYVQGIVENTSPCRRVINLCGKTSMMDLIGLLSRCDFLITNDSGPLHIAEILNTRSISFFGPETPSLYGPFGGSHSTVFYEDLFCSPCINVFNSKISHCKDNICLKAIKPASVVSLIKDQCGLSDVEGSVNHVIG